MSGQTTKKEIGSKMILRPVSFLLHLQIYSIFEIEFNFNYSEWNQ